MKKVFNAVEPFFAMVMGVLLMITLIFAGWIIRGSHKEVNHQLIDYNDSSYGDFYVVSEKRTGKDNIKILIIRDEEYNEYTIVLDTETGNISAITKY